MRICLIGPGKVGSHLGAAFVAAGHTITQVFSRNPDTATHYAEAFGASPCHQYNQLQQGADLYLLTISDDAIEPVACELAKQLDKQSFVVHSSGATPRSVLDAHFERSGVFYPLQSFSPGRTPDFAHIPLCVDARMDEDSELLLDLAQSLSHSVHRVSDAQRAALHVAAVFANNFTNHLFAQAAAILEKENLPFELLLPLIQETVEKIKTQDPLSMQTGPAVRGDQETMKRHQLYLNKHFPGSAALYQLLSQRISFFSHSTVSSPRNKKPTYE